MSIDDVLVKIKLRESKYDIDYLRFLLKEFDYSFVRTQDFAPLIPKKVIFNYPATIVFWEDDTKTVVKAQHGDLNNFDCEKGVALCFMKKILGNKGKYNNVLKKLIAEEYK